MSARELTLTNKPDYGEWTGIHPYAYSFGWIVANQVGSFRMRYRRLTRRGAERKARRLNKRSRRNHQYHLEADPKAGSYCSVWTVLGKIAEHPGRDAR